MPKIGTPTTRRSEPRDDLLKFIVERHQIYRRKQAGHAAPWTVDPILQQYRFCNVFRELDTETIWIAENWRKPHADDPDLWFAMVGARLVNWHESLIEIGFPVPWEPDHFVKVMEDRRQRQLKCFTGAYLIPASASGGSKAVSVAALLTTMWENRERLRRIVHGTLAQAHRKLMACQGLGSFLAGQVVADLKYVDPLRSAEDWWSWAASGPGSERGLNRVLGRDKGSSWDEWEWLHQLQDLHREISPLIRSAKMRRLHGQDVQNCLCEFDKYERTRLGEGTPRSRYPGAGPSNGKSNGSYASRDGS